MFVYTMNNRRFANPGNLIASLPFRTVGLAGRFTFGYDERYFAVFNFGYNASERFHEDFRWGLFPSAGEIGIASCRERVCQLVYHQVVGVALNTKIEYS